MKKLNCSVHCAYFLCSQRCAHQQSSMPNTSTRMTTMMNRQPFSRAFPRRDSPRQSNWIEDGFSLHSPYLDIRRNLDNYPRLFWTSKPFGMISASFDHLCKKEIGEVANFGLSYNMSIFHPIRKVWYVNFRQYKTKYICHAWKIIIFIAIMVRYIVTNFFYYCFFSFWK